MIRYMEEVKNLEDWKQGVLLKLIRLIAEIVGGFGSILNMINKL